MKHLQNFHVLKVKYYGATNTNGARVGIISDRFKQRITVPYNHNLNSTAEIAQDYLEKNGFNLIGKAEGKDCYYIISDTFEPLKNK